MSWADEPEEDRDLIEAGSRAFSLALLVMVLAVVVAIVTLPSWLAPLIHGLGGT